MTILGFNFNDLRLVINIFKMNVRDRYLGSYLGGFWAVFNPLFMLAVYTFVFGFVFKVRLPGAETTLAYVVWLISGYGPWIAMTEALMSSTNSVVGSSGIVKNMAFKTEILPISAALTGCITLTVSLLFLFGLKVVIGDYPTWHLIFLPVIIFIQFTFAIGIGFWLSAINVFFRDLSQMLTSILVITMFMTPIFYPISSLPAIMQRVSFVNPFYHIADGYRAVLIDGRLPDFGGLLYVSTLSGIVLFFGLRNFRRLKGHFDSAL